MLFSESYVNAAARKAKRKIEVPIGTRVLALHRWRCEGALAACEACRIGEATRKPPAGD